MVAAATAMVVNTTQPTASSEIGRRLKRAAPAHRHRGGETGGNTRSSTSSGQARREAGNEAPDNASQHQKNGRRNLESFGEHRNRRNYSQQHNESRDR
jgi:hypothetical protein